MKTLIIDIETAPNTAHVWGLWQQNVGLPQLLESGYVMCFAAKWEHKDKVMFYRSNVAGHAHRLFNEADAVVHYNGDNFDIPWLQTEMVKAGLTQPSGFVSIDLCKTVKQQFRFPSNKLEYVARELLGDGKAATGGHSTWVGCMAGSPEAWRKMRAYNEADVFLTERLYHRLKPFIRNLPNVGLYDGDGTIDRCPQCGGEDIIHRGYAYTRLSAYPRMSCKTCGRWFRSGRRVRAVDAR